MTSQAENKLREELERLKRKVGMGYEVQVRWLPGQVKHKKGRELEDEVVGNTIFVYAKDPERAIDLTAHGFTEWLLNQHSKPYRRLINKLIELFEDLQYEGKERLADAITKTLRARKQTPKEAPKRSNS